MESDDNRNCGIRVRDISGSLGIRKLRALIFPSPPEGAPRPRTARVTDSPSHPLAAPAFAAGLSSLARQLGAQSQRALGACVDSDCSIQNAGVGWQSDPGTTAICHSAVSSISSITSSPGISDIPLSPLSTAG